MRAWQAEPVVARAVRADLGDAAHQRHHGAVDAGRSATSSVAASDARPRRLRRRATSAATPPRAWPRSPRCRRCGTRSRSPSALALPRARLRATGRRGAAQPVARAPSTQHALLAPWTRPAVTRAATRPVARQGTRTRRRREAARRPAPPTSTARASTSRWPTCCRGRTRSCPSSSRPGVRVHCLRQRSARDLRWVAAAAHAAAGRAVRPRPHAHAGARQSPPDCSPDGGPDRAHGAQRVAALPHGRRCWANALTYRRNDAVIAVSQAVADSMPTTLAPPRPPATVEVLLHGVDHDAMHSGPAARAAGTAELGLPARALRRRQRRQPDRRRRTSARCPGARWRCCACRTRGPPGARRHRTPRGRSCGTRSAGSGSRTPSCMTGSRDDVAAAAAGLRRLLPQLTARGPADLAARGHGQRRAAGLHRASAAWPRRCATASTACWCRPCDPQCSCRSARSGWHADPGAAGALARRPRRARPGASTSRTAIRRIEDLYDEVLATPMTTTDYAVRELQDADEDAVLRLLTRVASPAVRPASGPPSSCAGSTGTTPSALTRLVAVAADGDARGCPAAACAGSCALGDRRSALCVPSTPRPHRTTRARAVPAADHGRARRPSPADAELVFNTPNDQSRPGLPQDGLAGRR